MRYTFPLAKSQQNGSTIEIDLLLEDGEIVVVVEVKSVLRVSDVQEFLEDLAAFPAYFPRYQGYQIYGAVAALSLDENADRYSVQTGVVCTEYEWGRHDRNSQRQQVSPPKFWVSQRVIENTRARL